MTMNKKLLIGAVLAGAVMLGGFGLYKVTGKNDSGAAFAQEGTAAEAAAMDSTWFLRCNEEGDAEASNKRGKCEMFQRQDVKETGQRVIEFAIGYPEGKDQARGILIMPLGIYLPAGAQMKVDENEPFKFQVRTCTAVGCVAYLTLTDPVLDIFKKGQKATVYMAQADGKTIGIEIPLKGFTKTLKEISS